ncbi:hypothetical protein [Caballeronia sp. Sq4a]|uniref:hypothetical protein n=1 Tax=Caballeronia sp. Sq4a TaxID=2878152 RepID=UPI00352D1224
MLLTAARVRTFASAQHLTNASAFFFARDERLFLVTSRHVVNDESSKHFPDSLDIELHVDPHNLRCIGQSMNANLVELYVSPNGDRWLLVAAANDHPFVRHVPSTASGGCSSDLSLSAFLSANDATPQQDALLRLLSRLAFPIAGACSTVPVDVPRMLHYGCANASRGKRRTCGDEQTVKGRVGDG